MSQVARAMTTYESMRHQHTGPVTAALTTGSLTADADAGAGPVPAAANGHGHAHPHKKRQKEGCWSQWKKLLGLDTFIATAMHGSKAGEVMARRRQNQFTRGMLRNCQDFWCDAGGAGSLFKGRTDGVSLLGGEEVDYRRLYHVPAGGGGMSYRRGGYESVGVEEEV